MKNACLNFNLLMFLSLTLGGFDYYTLLPAFNRRHLQPIFLTIPLSKLNTVYRYKYLLVGWSVFILLDLHCKENPIYVFPEKKLRGIIPNFHIHVFMSD
jgi:hypothetical protein